MNIVIELGTNESAAAEARVRAVAKATEQHDINFNGDAISVQRGDFTCLAAGSGHSDAAALDALVNRVCQDGYEFEHDGEYTLVPFAAGGRAKVLDVEQWVAV